MEKAQVNIQNINQELEDLKQKVLFQLSQEIEELQAKKNYLLAEVQELENSRQQQLIQQQKLAQEIAPEIAKQLQQIVMQQLSEQGLNNQETSLTYLNKYHSKVDILMSSFDFTLRTIFKTLQQDLSSYQSSLAQQLGQMYSLEQQGEDILEALIFHLKEELQTQNVLPPAPITAISSPPVILPQPPPVAEITKKEPHKPNKTHLSLKPQDYNFSLGISLIIFSILAFYFQNVVVAIIFNQSSLFGLFEIGGYLTPTLGNSFLILFLRMVSFVPILFLITGILSPQIWQDLKNTVQNRKLIGLIALSSFFLFLSSSLIYLALGFLPAGIAVTIFFIFALIPPIYSWLFFQVKPSLLPVLGLIITVLGISLILSQGFNNLPNIGLIFALFSGITFACHLFVMQFCTKKLHSIPFSLINSSLVLIFAFVSLLIPLPETWGISMEFNLWGNLIITGLFLGLLTLVSYLANNVGIGLIGASISSVLSSIGPILTSFLAWILIGQPLIIVQFLGILTVTIGVMLLNLERLFGKS